MSSLAQKISQKIEKNSTILLIGGLGSGKTFFAKEFISRVCSLDKNDITSPTFNIVSRYNQNEKIPIAHYDLYRLDGADELEQIGFFDDLGSICTIIEWPQIVLPFAPKKNIFIITISPISSFVQSEERLVKIESDFGLF